MQLPSENFVWAMQHRTARMRQGMKTDGAEFLSVSAHRIMNLCCPSGQRLLATGEFVHCRVTDRDYTGGKTIYDIRYAGIFSLTSIKLQAIINKCLGRP